ncbi:MAG TPA: TetR family transcriptional regulator [Pseudonocardia sp.]|jgi:AcrR family transcriptional regulator|nr:TetR family transcriptional regulator [Pseudonocardia sp.]
MATTRRYSSVVRDRQAESTRQEVVAAATRLFAGQGYARTSVAEIAAAAGVAVNTVYSSVGGKPDLIRAIIETSTGDGEITDSLDRIGQLTDPHEVLAELGRGTGDVSRRRWDGMSILLDNRRADPAVDELAEQAMRVYRQRLDLVADHLVELGAVRPELSSDAVSEIIAFYFGAAAWRSVRALGWSWQRAAGWLAEQAGAALLR